MSKMYVSLNVRCHDSKYIGQHKCFTIHATCVKDTQHNKPMYIVEAKFNGEVRYTLLMSTWALEDEAVGYLKQLLLLDIEDYATHSGQGVGFVKDMMEH